MLKFTIDHLYFILIRNYFFREVSEADVSNVEKKLLQTMDMILIRKKRLAIAKKEASKKINDNSKKKGIWAMLSPTGLNKGQESKYKLLFHHCTGRKKK